MKYIIQLILTYIILSSSHSFLLSQCNNCFNPETQFQLDTSPDGVLFMDACIISTCAMNSAEPLTINNPCGFDSIPTFWIDVYTTEDAKMLYVEVTDNDKPSDVSIAIYKGDCNSLNLMSFNTSSKTISCSQDDGSSHRIHMPLAEESNGPFHVAIGLINGVNEANEIQVCAGVTNDLYYCNSDAQPFGQNYSCHPKTTFQVIERSFSNEIDSDGNGVPGPFCPNEEIRIEFAYPFNLEGTGNGWFQGIIPMNNDNFLPIIPEKAHFNLSGSQWFGEGIPISNEVISRLCTYTDRYGRLQICNDLCNSCPCQGPVELGQALPGGWFWLSFGGGGCANDGTPSTMYGYPTSNPIVLEGYMDITVRDFVNIVDCSNDKNLEFGFQPFTDGMTGCWEDPTDECDILPGQTIDYEIDCNLPDPPLVDAYEQIINSGDQVNINLTPPHTNQFIEIIPIKNPEIDGAQSHLKAGTFNLLDQLTNLSIDEQVQKYIVRTRDTSIVCPSLQDTINITVAGKVCGGVNAVQYQIRYNDTTDLYDCYLVIKSGCATNPNDLVQFNSQFSIIMSTGSEYEIETLYNPIRTDNEEPMNWFVNEFIQNPAALPGYDFHTITPEISPISRYPSLYEGDTLRLFSLSVIPADLCDLPIRLYENGIDPDSSEPSMNGADMSQGFTIGGSIQIYDSNLPGIIPNVDLPSISLAGDSLITIGSNTQLITQSEGAWSSDNDSILIVSETGLVTGVDIGCANITLSDSESGCNSNKIEICVIELMEPHLEDSLLCGGQKTFITNYDAYQFEIFDSTIISIDSGGIVNALNAGTTQILVTGPNGYSKTLVITINDNPEASNLGRDTIPISGKTQLTPMIGGTWKSSNPQVAIISPSGLVTGVSVGCTEFIFTASITGCQSNIVEVCVDLSSNTDDFNDNTDVSLYPNPTNNFVRIFSNQIPKNISIFNLEGKLLTKTQFKDHFDLSPYQNGIYIVKIDFIKGSTYRKIVKN